MQMEEFFERVFQLEKQVAEIKEHLKSVDVACGFDLGQEPKPGERGYYRAGRWVPTP